MYDTKDMSKSSKKMKYESTAEKDKKGKKETLEEKEKRPVPEQCVL